MNVKSLKEYYYEIFGDYGIGEIKNSFRKLYEVLREGDREIYPGIKFFPKFYAAGLKGLPEVANSLIEVLEICSNIYEKDGRIHYIYLYGPTGSGKSFLGKLLEEFMEEALYRYPSYKLVFVEIKRRSNKSLGIDKDEGEKKYTDGIKSNIRYICVFNEEPCSIFSSKKVYIPKKVKNEFRKKSEYKGELCDSCAKEVNNFLTKHKLENIHKTIPEGLFKNLENILIDLSNNFYVVEHLPSFINIDLADEELLDNIDKILEKSNRGILHINLDNIKNFKDQNIQFLLRISDAYITFRNGNSIHIDLIPILYSNETLLESIKRNETLERRIGKFIPIRRLLSISLEAKMFEEFKLPFSHKAPNSLLFYSMFTVGSRINAGNLETLEKLLDIYDRYENYKKLNDEEFKIVRERILRESGIPEDGWSKGLSYDEGLKKLYSFWFSKKFKCLTYDELLRIMNSVGQEYRIQSELVKRKIEESSFKDLIISLICALENINPEDIDKEFNYYIELLSKKIEGKEVISTIQGTLRIDEEMDKVAKRLLITNRESLDKIIKEYMLNENIEERLTFQLLLKKYPNLITANETIKRYLNWSDDPEKMIGEQKEKLRKIIDKMKLLGYCEECAISSIKIAKKKLT